MDSVTMILFSINNEHSKLRQIECKKKRIEAEGRLHNYITDLKWTNDALFKALEMQENRIKQFSVDSGISVPKTKDASLLLTAKEEQEIVDAIKLESDDAY